MTREEHCDRDLHPNFTAIRGRRDGRTDPQIEACPSIVVTSEQIDDAYLRYHPGYVEDGDIDWVEHYWAADHYKTVGWRLAFNPSQYRFYFETEEDAMRMKMEL